MPDALGDLLAQLPPAAEDAVIAGLLLLPLGALAIVVLRGLAAGPLVAALLRGQLWVSAVFAGLIAVSVAIGVSLIAQERGLREGTARAADKFDLVIAAPGSEITAMLAAVYLQPAALPLLDGETYAEIARHPRADLVAPIAFGDSWEGAPVVGSTSDFVRHLSGELGEGRLFETETEAVAGAHVPLAIGARLSPAHGHGEAADAHAHGGFEYEVVGRMAPTGSPWDRAIVVPVEAVWWIHGLANGHGPGWDGTLGPPFSPSHFPGTPAALVTATSLGATYVMQAEFTTERTMAFFPGTVLARLHALMGDVREVMSFLALVTQVLVTVGVLAGVMLVMRLLARRLALLRALGAPERFVFAVVWGFALTLILLGALIGLGLGLIASWAISAIITARTDVLVEAGLGWPEIHAVAGFVSVMALLVLLPAWITIRRPVTADLRG